MTDLWIYIRAEKNGFVWPFMAQIGQKTVKTVDLLKKCPLKWNIPGINDFYQP